MFKAHLQSLGIRPGQLHSFPISLPAPSAVPGPFPPFDPLLPEPGADKKTTVRGDFSIKRISEDQRTRHRTGLNMSEPRNCQWICSQIIYSMY